jgi:hypothetical protein
MQTVGHVSGAAHFYSRQQLKTDPFPTDQVNLFISTFSYQNALFRI